MLDRLFMIYKEELLVIVVFVWVIIDLIDDLVLWMLRLGGSKEWRVIKIVLIVVGIFVFLIILIIVIDIISLLGCFICIFLILVKIIVFMVYVNVCVNVFIYVGFNMEMRNIWVSIFWSIK